MPMTWEGDATRDRLHRLLYLGQGVTALLAALGCGMVFFQPILALFFFAMTAGLAVWGAWWMRRLLAKSLDRAQVLDRALLQSEKLAEIGQLAAGVAHEINNPLAIIGQEAELALLLLGAENPAGHGEDIRDGLRQIALQVRRGGEITRKLLDFSRPREALVQLLDCNRLVEDMALLVERDERLLHVTLVRNYDEKLPAVAADAPLLRQVVLNLLNNAAQALQQGRPAGQARGNITVTTRLAPPWAEIEVRDDGPGIAPEHLDKLFTPFFTTKDPGQGTGLGLALCRRMIESLGGTIEAMGARSAQDRGATFLIRLPLPEHVAIRYPSTRGAA